MIIYYSAWNLFIFGIGRNFLISCSCRVYRFYKFTYMWKKINAVIFLPSILYFQYQPVLPILGWKCPTCELSAESCASFYYLFRFFSSGPLYRFWLVYRGFFTLMWVTMSWKKLTKFMDSYWNFVKEKLALCGLFL